MFGDFAFSLNVSTSRIFEIPIFVNRTIDFVLPFALSRGRLIHFSDGRAEVAAAMVAVAPPTDSWDSAAPRLR